MFTNQINDSGKQPPRPLTRESKEDEEKNDKKDKGCDIF